MKSPVWQLGGIAIVSAGFACHSFCYAKIALPLLPQIDT